MKILVLGAAGKMGRAVSWYLGKDPQISKVGLLDAHESALKPMATDADKFNIHTVRIEDSAKLQEVMKEYDLKREDILNALSYAATLMKEEEIRVAE
jgi:saccharopine dehydrogenase-like NADP-dependent oxidoreductase